MAKVYKSNLPKVISKANKDISTIIESDIASESAILKGLVDQVLKANLEVKKKNNTRITETKRRINELDEEISSLNVSIDDIDRDTAIRQLNEMVDTENNIFLARQEVRFFDNEKASEKIEFLEEIYASLLDSIQKMYGFETHYHNILKDSNDMLFERQITLSVDVINLMKDLFDRKSTFVAGITEFKELHAKITEIETKISTTFDDEIASYIARNATSTSSFTDVDDDINISAKIEIDHANKVEELELAIEHLKESHIEQMETIRNELTVYENSIKVELENRDKQSLQAERQKEQERQDEMKRLRLLIIDSEKKANFNKMTKLMKQLDKLEAQKLGVTTQKVEKEFDSLTKKTKIKSVTTQKNTEMKYVQDLNKLEHELALENIKYEEAKILYKIKSDRDALVGDQAINKEHIQHLKGLLTEKLTLSKELLSFKRDLRIEELKVMQANELREIELISQFKELLISLKEVEHKRLTNLLIDINTYEVMKQEQVMSVKKAVEDIKLNQELSSIEKLILKKRNETVIMNEKVKEEANSDIIYQESLIDIAKKEHELQLVKVKSLYENERALAEDQINRINLGLKVNDAFVKTTLENQLLFAEQQMKCAESEFEIRVESINLTRGQELDYATKKIDRFKHTYEYEKSKIQKELDDKLEDLNYKLLLFTDEKDNREIQGKIDALQSTYGNMIDEIDQVQNQDQHIIRYQKVIDDANKRADDAIEEASLLKSQTISSFEQLYAATKEKYDQIIETDQTEETKGIMPVINNQAISNADERLQKAIREAEALYKEKISEPTRIIEERKAFLSETVTSTESDDFIDEQKALKKEKIRIHKEKIDEFHEEQERALKPLEDMLFKAKLIQEKELEQIRESLFLNPVYRNETDINQDYDGLFEKEKRLYEGDLKAVTTYVSGKLPTFDPIGKTIQSDVKKTIKLYKKYIRFASRGLTSQKKDLAKKYDKLLRKAKSDVESMYKEKLNAI